jgi:hypothetical protein
MKIGSLHLAWLPARQVIEQETRDYLAGPEVQRAVARMARSEVKNYMAELAEQAEVPFPSPAGFLRALRLDMTRFGSTTGLGGGEDDDMEADAPFTLGATTLPNGHTTGCTCPDKYDGLDPAQCGGHARLPTCPPAESQNVANLRKTGFATEDDS